MAKIYKSKIPAVSVLNGVFPRIDYQDCYAMDVYRNDIELNDVVRCFFTTAPAWVVKLMKLRDNLGKMVGLKTNNALEKSSSDPNISSFKPGEKFGLFQILERNENEVIMGTDDKHLNFRVSIFLSDQGPAKKISISTIVVLHNSFGRAYMKMVTPFHKMVVPGMMNKIYKGLVRLPALQ